MSVPTVTVITPSSGFTGGRRTVMIMGGDFQLAPGPPPTGPAPAPNPSVEVLFGGEPGTNVQVVSSARLFVHTPRSPIAASAGGSGSVDVEIRNIDQAGDLVGSETVTVADGFTYQRPDLNAQPEADFTRLVRQFIRELRVQLIDNVNLATNTDWADEPDAMTAYVSEIPGIVLVGPTLRENRFYSLNPARQTGDTATGMANTFRRQRPPFTVDLVFVVVGVSDDPIADSNFMMEFMRFVDRNECINMLCDPSDPSLGSASYEFDFEPDGVPKAIAAPNASNIRAFRGEVVIRGFDIEDEEMTSELSRALIDTLDEGAGSFVTPSAVQLDGGAGGEFFQLGQAYKVGPSPGDC